MKSEDLYYDHYKDTFEKQLDYLKGRNRLTLVLLFLMVFLLALVVKPMSIGEKANIYLDGVAKGLSFNLSSINTIIIFVSLWVEVRYFQVVMQIERMYSYLHECEEKLNKEGEYVVNREGAYYLKSYPWLKELVDFCYVVLLPIAIVVIAIVRIVTEWNWTGWLKCVDVCGLLMIVIFSLLYLSHRILREEYFSKTAHPGLDLCKRICGYLRMN